MISVSLLVSTQRPGSELEGLMELGPVVVREIRDSYPAQRRLYAVFFVSRTQPFDDLDLQTNIVNPDGSVLEASRKRIRLRGTWDFATGSVDLGHVYLPAPGPYRFNLYVKDRAAGQWPDDPHCFWLVYATTEEAATDAIEEGRPAR
jgi:hypothetical protein